MDQAVIAELGNKALQHEDGPCSPTAEAVLFSRTGNTPLHHTLTRDALPQPPSVEIREKISGRIFRDGDAFALAKKHERVLVERAGLARQEDALAAYVDKKRDKRRSPAEVGIECTIRPHQKSSGIYFLVAGRAESRRGTLSGQIDASDYKEARDCLFAMIEAAGKWIDPQWFDRLLHGPSPKNGSKSGKKNSREEAEAKQMVRQDADRDRRGPAWRGLCKVLRDMCRQKRAANPVCVIAESEIILRLPERREEMRLILEDQGLLKATPISREIIRMVRTRSNGCAFAFHEGLYSPTRMAIELMHELRTFPGENISA
ncbi:hypothetical protein [Paracidobacterium acidisoli]|uniref:Uncharacterized protein n=1 Tax=Paracidobacterium acidisoli TaxID=2303751 RepID=A0A372IJX4_9BACT|nr:hypothetical protein [Paracidobacterium acidisoli]MBT9333114.1 hypothetical protein [Paracidobacterium acidisoli]